MKKIFYSFLTQKNSLVTVLLFFFSILSYKVNGQAIIESWAAPECNSVHKIASDSLGNAYVVYGYAAKRNIGRIDVNGVVDPSWVTYPVGTNVKAIAVDPLGNVFTANTDKTISKISPSGVVNQSWVTLANNVNAYLICIDSLGTVYTSNTDGSFSKITASGVLIQNWATANPAITYNDIAVDGDGNLLACSSYNSVYGLGIVSKVASDGTLTEFFKSYPNSNIGGSGPVSIIADHYGNFYTANLNRTISKIFKTQPTYPFESFILSWAYLG